MSHPTLGLKQWFTLAESYARNLSAIGHTDDQCHYARMRFHEVIAKEFTRLRSPALIADVPELEGGTDGGTPRVRRNVAFSIVARLTTDRSNSTEVLQLEDLCQRLAHQVLGRMRKEKTLRLSSSQATSLAFHGDLELGALEGDIITHMLRGNWVGYRVAVPVLHIEPRLVYNAEVWNA
jgi:hypothetical protein